MARRNLARTVIEGGRDHRRKHEVAQAHRRRRAHDRGWLAQLELHDDEDDYSDAALDALAVPEIGRYDAWRGSTYDRLAPLRRWLSKQAGRPWNKVYSELCARYDGRSVAGNHVRRHARDYIEYMDGDWHRTGGRTHHFVVDRRGILVRPWWFATYPNQLLARWRRWAKYRRWAETPAGLWWFRRTADHRFVPVGPVTKGEQKVLAALPPSLRAQLGCQLRSSADGER